MCNGYEGRLKQIYFKWVKVVGVIWNMCQSAATQKWAYKNGKIMQQIVFYKLVLHDWIVVFKKLK